MGRSLAESRLNLTDDLSDSGDGPEAVESVLESRGILGV